MSRRFDEMQQNQDVLLTELEKISKKKRKKRKLTRDDYRISKVSASQNVRHVSSLVK